jgi:Ca2+-binding RTX toxin-like protein
MANFFGTTGNDIQNGTALDDAFDFSQGGKDTLNGRGGNDIFTMGAQLKANDIINGGSGEDDEVVLDGDYNIVFGVNTMTNVETLRLLGGHDYQITSGDGTMGMGDALTIEASALGVDDQLKFLGHGENDNAVFTVLCGRAADVVITGAGEDFLYGGKGGDSLNGNGGGDHIYGGKGDDVIFGFGGDDYAEGGQGDDNLRGDFGGDTYLGGAGDDLINTGDDSDQLIGGGGRDRLIGGAAFDNFVFLAVADSTGAGCDHIEDFDTNIDVMHVAFGVSGVDAVINTGALTEATFDSDLAIAVNGTNHVAQHAVVFAPNAGDLAGRVYLVVDGNNTAGYQAGLDLVVEVTGGTGFVEGGFDINNFI